MLAQEGWSDDRIIKARNVLEHLLRDTPGTLYGADKSIVANAMADRRATMVLFRTEEDLRKAFQGPLGGVGLAMQDLRANECPIEGSEDYMAHRTRDASYEEILHLIHDYGIKPALPEYQAELRKANDAAAKRGWRGWPDDEPENHPNEYIGVLYDNFLDLWTVSPTVYEGRDIEAGRIPPGSSHFGAYFAGSRARLQELDSLGHEMIERFFPRHLTYTPELPESFDGTFSIQRDPALRYTAKSQHLQHVILTGANDAKLVGNDLDNRLTGNRGDNVLRGNRGDDTLLGGTGDDTAEFSGNWSDYSIVEREHAVMVKDGRLGRDGTDVLVGVERAAFADRTVRLN